MRQLAAGEEVGQELHGVGAQARYILIPARGRRGALGAQSRDAIFHVLGHLGADLEPEDQLVGQEGRERDEKAAEAAADVRDCHGFGQGFDRGGFGKGGLLRCDDESRVVGGPVHEGWARGARSVIWLAVSGRGGNQDGRGLYYVNWWSEKGLAWARCR